MSSDVDEYSGKFMPVGNSELPTFLGFLEAQMEAQPEWITAADPAQLARIGKLVKGVNAG